jgi:glycosyltransferase involved in cell wall biosynthesis
LPKLLRNNPKLVTGLKDFTGIYVETHSMIDVLNKSGLNNVHYLPNFKRLNNLDERELVYSYKEPYKLCTFSRVMKEKGIEDAINVVKTINNSLKKIVFTLDIYGQIDKNYKEQFEKIIEVSPSYISYKGIVNYSKSVEVIKNYFALVFPTYYVGEGFAGTILDAFAAGVPVIASDWKYNKEIIHDKLDGLIFDINNIEMLKMILLEVYKKPNVILEMKMNCLKRAKEYKPENAIKNLIEYL